jgi:hypothetical protein
MCGNARDHVPACPFWQTHQPGYDLAKQSRIFPWYFTNLGQGLISSDDQHGLQGQRHPRACRFLFEYEHPMPWASFRVTATNSVGMVCRDNGNQGQLAAIKGS